MDTLSAVLQPYKELVGMVASVVTIGQFFSGFPICYDIYKNKSTAGKNSTPFVGGVVMGILVLKYSFILQDKAMFQVNVAGIFLNVLYTLCYTRFAQRKWDEVVQPLSFGIGVLAAVFAYLQMEDPSNIEFRYGFLITILSLLLLASPLIEIKLMIREKDASSIPIPIVFMAFWVSLLWLIYGVILNNIFMVVQNIIGLIICTVQLVLYVIYPKPQPGMKKKKVN